MKMTRDLNRLLAGLGASMAFCLPAAANVIPFTFVPEAANPPLAGPGSAVTADRITVSNDLYAVVQPDFSFTAHQFLPVTGFTRNGATVAAPGLGSSYGLYFEISGTGSQPPGSFTYHTLNIALKADPGNLDGTLVATASGIAFTNTGATGAADDVVLATGTLSSAALKFNPATGVRNAHYVETFTPVPGEAGFFGAPLDDAALLDIQLTTNPNVFTSAAGPNGTTVNFVNGGFGAAQFVPEPASLLLLCSPLGGLAIARRRYRS
jgi:hypothetical protein